MPEPALVLLDLDGTLSDSAPGITGSVRSAYTALGLPLPEGSLRSFVGPPLPVSFAAHGVPQERVPEAIAAYRDAFEAGGMWQSPPFEGIADQLRLLRAGGHRLLVATSKPQMYARPICDRWGLTELVDGVFGAPPDHIPSTKATVIADALASLGDDRPGPGASLMVGDRHHDVDGAAAHGIACLGVGWGYADANELHGAVEVVSQVADLAATVERVLSGLAVGP